MKHQKCIIYLIVVMFLCTGCNVKYELKISDEMFYNEQITTTDYQQYTEETDAYTLYSYKGIYGKMYDISSKREEKKYELILTSSRTVLSNEYLNQYFSQAIKKDQEKIIITATPTSLLSSLLTDQDVIEAEVGTLTISIKSAREVINHNADEAKDNTYTWIYNKSNYSKPIELTLKNTQEKKVIIEKKKNNDIYFIIAGAIVIIIVVIVIVKQYIKSKKNNQL